MKCLTLARISLVGFLHFVANFTVCWLYVPVHRNLSVTWEGNRCGLVMGVACNQYFRERLKNNYGGVIVILIPAEKINVRSLLEDTFQECNL